MVFNLMNIDIKKTEIEEVAKFDIITNKLQVLFTSN